MAQAGPRREPGGGRRAVEVQRVPANALENAGVAGRAARPPAEPGRLGRGRGAGRRATQAAKVAAPCCRRRPTSTGQCRATPRRGGPADHRRVCPLKLPRAPSHGDVDPGGQATLYQPMFGRLGPVQATSVCCSPALPVDGTRPFGIERHAEDFDLIGVDAGPVQRIGSPDSLDAAGPCGAGRPAASREDAVGERPLGAVRVQGPRLDWVGSTVRHLRIVELAVRQHRAGDSVRASTSKEEPGARFALLHPVDAGQPQRLAGRTLQSAGLRNPNPAGPSCRGGTRDRLDHG